MQDVQLLLCCSLGLCCSGVLRGIDLQLVTNISERSVSPIFKDHATFLDCLTTEDGTVLKHQ